MAETYIKFGALMSYDKYKYFLILIIRTIIILMFANAYQNGHYFEIWDSKCNRMLTQPAMIKMKRISSCAAWCPILTKNTMISNTRATCYPWSSKILKYVCLLLIRSSSHCTNDTWLCTSLYLWDLLGPSS